MKEKAIKVLMVEPQKHPTVTTLNNDLDSLQKAVSIGAEYQGLIEIIPLGSDVCLLCNEEGKLIGLEGNRRIGNDIIAGVFYVAGDTGDDLKSLSDEQIARYNELLYEPETFTQEEVEECLIMNIKFI